MHFDVEHGKANLYIDGIFTAHKISKLSHDMANQIICDVAGEGRECLAGRNVWGVFGIPTDKADELARRLVHLWRADSGVGAAGPSAAGGKGSHGQLAGVERIDQYAQVWVISNDLGVGPRRRDVGRDDLAQQFPVARVHPQVALRQEVVGVTQVALSERLHESAA
ncbi:hypothetical protein ACTWPT_11575 [Nonomuraea sp. 3N208]|uniref:hypothetical protein n=1 Tax=Nonomuraea sp. 3N208 TaxID=3457421 RepID=UPI003FCE6BC1